jgi:hypothetical protein
MYRLSKPKCWVDGLSSDLFRLPVLLEFWIPYCPVRWSPSPMVACQLTSQPVCLLVCIPWSSVSAYWIAYNIGFRCNVYLVWPACLLNYSNCKHECCKLPINLKWRPTRWFFAPSWKAVKPDWSIFTQGSISLDVATKYVHICTYFVDVAVWKVGQLTLFLTVWWHVAFWN